MNNFHTKEADSVILELKTSKDKGLTSEEAETRLHEYGLNVIEEEAKISPFKILLDQFKSPLIWILIAATVISLFLKEYIDAGIISTIIILNAFLGFFQEYKAEKAIESLKKMASPHAKVIRNGQKIEIESRYLVPGDILVLETGDKISADTRLIEIHSFETQEAALTGESLPVIKTSRATKPDVSIADRHNMAYFGTVVTKGRAIGVVVGTGMKTEFGKIARLIQEAAPEMTPLQKKLKHLGKVIGLAVIAVAIVVFAAGLIREAVIGTINLSVIHHLFFIAIALAVAAIPEGLPAVVTIALGIGVQRMVKKNALIRKLPSVETLGSVNVICTDKTGTLTKNEMTVKKIWVSNQMYDVTGIGYGPEGAFVLNKQIIKPDEDLKKLLLTGALCNDAKVTEEDHQRKIIGDPTEGCLIVSAEKAGLKKSELDRSFVRLDEIPFSSERKRMTTINNISGKKVALTKGAPDVILNLCERIIINGKVERLSRPKIKEILDTNEKLASEALRVLGFAYKEISSSKEAETDMVFIGLQAMIDPPREEVKEAIQKCKTAGIRVIMITGDHKTTAEAIAKELGIEGRAITGQELEKMSDFAQQVETIGVYARVDPEHKIRIVEALKKKGYYVAMTGDGVNDAPALKKADIGIAMGITGTDVSKEASDMILTDDNFTSIVNAIEEGRGIYNNIKKFFAFLISGNLGEVGIIFFAILIGLPLPLTAVLILLINLVTDGLPAVALSVDPPEPGAMQRPPRKEKERFYTGLAPFIYHYPAIMVVVALGLFFWTSKNSSLVEAQTVVFLTVAMFELYQAFAARSVIFPSFKVGILKNRYLVGAVLLSLAICSSVIYVPFLRDLFGTVPLSGAEFIIIALVSSSGFIYLELYKVLKMRKSQGEQNVP